ncbi:LysM peptidoglycan-binding domain-containing protein [Flavobacterium ardleyense]|uniref:LysM peptidoglycan-binding domain-containing protein n=1 Tax=Flavobacterium ardleyense TaxID=2038737 RepID=A0ABW5ZA48_9FLAO
MKFSFTILILAFFFQTVSAQESFVEYIVNKGETVHQIAKKFNISKNEIYELNPDAVNGLKENQVLFVSVINLISHEVKPKETLYGIALKYNVTIEDIKQLNPNLGDNTIKVGNAITIPKINKNFVASLATKNKSSNSNENAIHEVKPKETLFSIARLYNVSVSDLDVLNTDLLENGLRIGQQIKIPYKKKTLDGKARVINEETIFHVVAPQETKFGIAKKYGITIDQLELQNPEILSGLNIGTKLAINLKQFQPTNSREELMVAIAEKQIALEKSKVINIENSKLKEQNKIGSAELNKKTVEIEDLQDRVVVQKQMNEKVLKVNSLKVDLNEIDKQQSGSAEKLKLVLAANKNVQEVLLYKLDSLVYNMKLDVEELKTKEIGDLATAKQLEKNSYANLKETNSLLQELKKDLANNRSNYALIMNKVKQINLEENKVYKKKSRELATGKSNSTISSEDISEMEKDQNLTNTQNDALISEIEKLASEKDSVIKEKVKRATFYSEESRQYDDKMALQKLKRHKEKVENDPSLITPSETREANNFAESMNLVSIEVIENLKDVPNGFYLVVGKFTDAKERDEKVMQLINNGKTEASFFYNFNTLSYYVYTKIASSSVSALQFYNINQDDALYKDLLIVRLTYNN